MATLRNAADAIINRAEAAAAGASAEDLVYLAKATEAVGVSSVVGFINATSEMQNARILATGDEQNGRVIATGDSEVARVVQTMGDAVGVISTKGDLLWHSGSGAARLPVGSSGQVLQVGTGGQLQWGASKVINTYHHFFADITRTTWGSKGNLLTGSTFTYTPVRPGSWFWVDHRIHFSTNQSYTATEIMVNVAGGGWQVTTSMPLKRGAENWTNLGGSHYYGGSGSGYHGDGNSPYKVVGSVLIAPAYAAGQSMVFGVTAWCQGSSWFSVNESYNQNTYVARYGWSEVHVFELQAPA
ncbi:hypothetical protein MTBLM5_290045 [Magnetospirillum sp. LM-5]|jgi:hypothetical protein|uniref:hypothetical protein n=1 Tax=Magnetospirillum sp. LM-5 TaxID=2681466 RepID=UPI00137E8AEE|nr:hypothetical protein [Magnetospirillum sp. LM-5]CAA7618977.1 hypothetical protein MTBLM5_290045 [Magnetospirillum sp. LM-5]